MSKRSALLLLAAAAAAVAQGGLPGRGPRAGEGASLRFLGAAAGRPGPLVTGSPYSADAVTETTQVLSDGNKIHQTNTTHVYRDSQGRTRREPGLNVLSSAAPGSTMPSLAFIDDPVAGVSYAVDLTNRTATKRTLPQRATRPRPNGQPRRAIANTANQVTESLGRQLISGVPADGTRTTITIPAGQIGNSQPIQIVTERWYSPELQLTVLLKRSDPRTGESVFQLINLSRAEPPSTLFEVPADFQVTEQTRGLGIMRRLQGGGPTQ